MALFLQKPIFWNTENYLKPSGAPATSGYPETNGYGHEEWNNSLRLSFLDKGQALRTFHTEGVGNAPVDLNFGQTFVFMTVSHDRIQQLVGIAANASSLLNSPKVREDLVGKLDLGDLSDDAWAVRAVRESYRSKSQFEKHWNKDLHWIPNWFCPEEGYLWLDTPVTLNPLALTGKKRLLAMYNSHTVLDRETAERFMDAIPLDMRGEKWRYILEAIQLAPNTPAYAKEFLAEGQSATDALALVLARRGQGRFRDQLMQQWGSACAVTGLSCRSVLRASHVKPWAKSNSHERLDPNNGLLLTANLDALFDVGLITFEDDGGMRVSTSISSEQRNELGIPRRLRTPPVRELRSYLEHHRAKFKP